MQRTPIEVVVALLVFTTFWIAVVGVIYLGRRRRPAAWAHLLAQRRSALVLAGITLLGMILGRLGGDVLGGLIGGLLLSVGVFCQALIGLAVARSIAGFEPLPVTAEIIRRAHPWRQVALLVAVALPAAVLAIAVGSVGQGVMQSIFHETSQARQAAGMFPPNKILSFFSLLAGAGILEETPYRLVLVSLIWRWSGRRWLAVWIGALAFAAYHLTPLDSLYQIFWQYPISHSVATVLIGLIWGYVYTRRGFETAVLSHTLSDWLSVLAFT